MANRIKEPAKAKKKKNYSKSQIFEMVWYPLCGAVALWGIVYLILGIIAKALPGEDKDLQLADKAIEKAFGLGFMWWGLILIVIGTVLAVISLCANGKGSDREQERNARRQARLNANREQEEAVVEAKVEPIEEPKIEEVPEETAE